MTRRRDERGAVAVFTAAAVVLMVLMAAFAVDLGMQRVVRSDMQAVADVVALDAARLIDGRTAGQIRAGSDGKPALSTVVGQSWSRNSNTVGEIADVQAVLVHTDISPLGEVVPRRDAGGGVMSVADGQKPDGVYVTAAGSVDFAFAAGSGDATRSALAKSSENACFRLGSFAASLNSGNSAILGELIDDAIEVTGVGYTGLASSEVSLFGLATQFGVGTVEGLVDIEYASLRTLYLAAAAALQGEGGSLASVDVLNALAARVDSSLRVRLSDAMELSTAGTAALQTRINLLDLVAGSALASNGINFLDLGVVWNVPMLSQGPVDLQIVQRPQFACGQPGSARAETAQVSLKAYPDLNIPDIAGLDGPKVDVVLEVALAGASGLLTSITCGAGTTPSPDAITVRVDRSLVSTVNLSVPVRLTGTIDAADIIPMPSIFGLTSILKKTTATVDITVDLGFTSTTPPSSIIAGYAVPPRDYTDPEPVGGSAGVVIPHSSLDPSRVSGTITVNGQTKTLGSLTVVGGVTLQPIFDDLIKKNVLRGVNGFIDNINDRLTGVAQLLGLQVAGADLYGVRKPVCNDPRLTG